MPFFDMELADLQHYVPDVRAPEDFDDFWSETIATARELAREPSVVPYDSLLDGFDVFDVEFSGFGGQRIKAWFIAPSKREGPLPIVIEYLGYGDGRGLPHQRLVWPAAGYAYFVMDTRGQGSETADPVGSGPSASGFLTRGIEDASSYYYRRVFTDAVLAVDAARGLAGVDPTRIAISGGSQGGGITLAVAGLRNDLAAVLADVPFLCHFERAVGLTGIGPYAEIVRFLSIHRDADDQSFRTLSYFDGANFAARAIAPALFSVALMDPVCPPSTVFAAYNRYAGDASIAVYRFNEHEGGQSHHWRRQATWLRQLTDQ